MELHTKKEIGDYLFFIYHINYPEELKDLCAMEMRALFKIEANHHYIQSDISYSAGKSMFFKAKLNVLTTNLESVSTLPKRKFKLQYLDMDHTLDYSEGLALTKALSGIIPGQGMMTGYDILYGVTKIKDTFYFGVLEKDHQSYQKHKDKPFTFSQALDYKLAHSVVNIGYGQKQMIQAVDPCCGCGTLILEALGQHLSIEGYDINPTMIFQSNKNISYYGYHLNVQRSDFLISDKTYDLCFIDLPYNLYAKSSKEVQHNLIQHSYQVSERLLLISYDPVDVSPWKQWDHCVVKKGKFHRHVYLLGKGCSE